MLLFDVVAIGDTIVDLFVKLPDKGSHFSVDKAANELRLVLGEKNPVDAASFSIGGNATHVAMGLTRLGYRVGLAAEIGDDEFAPKIHSELERYGVNKS